MEQVSQVSFTTNSQLDEHVKEIRRLGKRVVGDVVEIGRRLTECKRIVGHGNWLPWLDREFGWDERTAQRFMSLHGLAGKYDNLSDLDLPLSALYLLASKSTPEAAREEVVRRASGGEKMTVRDISRTIKSSVIPITKTTQIGVVRYVSEKLPTSTIQVPYSSIEGSSDGLTEVGNANQDTPDPHVVLAIHRKAIAAIPTEGWMAELQHDFPHIHAELVAILTEEYEKIGCLLASPLMRKAS